MNLCNHTPVHTVHHNALEVKPISDGRGLPVVLLVQQPPRLSPQISQTLAVAMLTSEKLMALNASSELFPVWVND